MSLLSAVAMTSALDQHTTGKLGIGWVSTIFCDGKQIGEVKIEGKLDNFSAFDYVIISFAVKLVDTDFPPRVTDLIKKVFASENTSIPLIIAKNILSKFFNLYPKRLKSPEKYMDTYKRKFIQENLCTKYIEDGKKKYCKILGVEAADGRLKIETKSGEIKYLSGSKSIILPSRIKIKN